MYAPEAIVAELGGVVGPASHVTLWLTELGAQLKVTVEPIATVSGVG